MTLDKFKMTNKVVIITGGAGLLGVQHAEAILDAGGIAVLLDINAAALRAAKLQLVSDKLFTLECDVTEEPSVQAALDFCVQQFGRAPEVLINNAAIDAKISPTPSKNFSRLENFQLDQWNREIAVGLTGSFLCAKVFGAQMAKNKYGVIVNIASDLGLVAPDQRIYAKPGQPDDQQPVKPVTYSVIKHALIGLTKYLATYWAGSGVRCNAFAPGGVFSDQPDAFVVQLANLIPLGRMASRDEYKASILYLASDASSFMTGAVLVNDGGRSVW